MPLWIEKYRPKQISDLDVNAEQKEMLQVMMKNSKCNIPHILIYGPSGSGKKTRVNAILRVGLSCVNGVWLIVFHIPIHHQNLISMSNLRQRCR